MRWRNNQSELFKANGKLQVFLFQPKTIPKYGDVVRVKGYLEYPNKVHNPGEFDYLKYLRNRKICCLLKGYGNFSLRVYGRDPLKNLLGPVHRLRLYLEKRLEKLFSYEDSSILKAVLLGRKKAIAPKVRDAFMKTGTAHLLAISGLHMAIIAGSFYFFLLFFGLASRGAALGSILFIFCYIVLAGAGFPVRRAGWMAAIAFLGVLFDRERSTLNAFFFAFFLILLLDPKAPTSLSFQLSFISVFSMMLFLKGFSEEWKWSETFLRTLTVIMGTLPIILLHFNVFSLTNFIANSLAIPMFHVALVGGLLSLLFEPIPWIGEVCVFLTHHALGCVLLWVKALSSLDWGYFFIRSPRISFIVGYYLSLLSLLWGLKVKAKLRTALKIIGISGIILFGSLFLIPRSNNLFSFTALYMGKNEVFHLRTPRNANWIFNAGRSIRWTLEPYLKSEGVKHLAGILVTSTARKYTGGLSDLSRNFIVNYFLTPVSLKENFDVNLDRRINKAYLYESNPVQIEKDITVEIIVLVKGLAGYRVSYQGWNFLLLPSLHSEIYPKLQERIEKISSIQILMLPSINRFSAKEMNSLMEFIAPDVVSIPHEIEGMRDYFNERDIALLDLENYGALRFEIDAEESLHVSSFLKGEVGTWNANR